MVRVKINPGDIITPCRDASRIWSSSGKVITEPTDKPITSMMNGDKALVISVEPLSDYLFVLYKGILGYVFVDGVLKV